MTLFEHLPWVQLTFHARAVSIAFDWFGLWKPGAVDGQLGCRAGPGRAGPGRDGTGRGDFFVLSLSCSLEYLTGLVQVPGCWTTHFHRDILCLELGALLGRVRPFKHDVVCLTLWLRVHATGIPM